MAKRAISKAKQTRAKPPAELQSLLDFVRYAATRFAGARLAFGQGTDDAIGDAVLLVCGALDLDVESFEAFAAARLTREERDRITSLIETRIRTRKPVPYLVNRVYMRGVPFYVDERAIIPRSFIGEIIQSELFMGDEAALMAPESVGRVLDLCTGSGCIAILAASSFPNATIDAVDISKDALTVAAINVRDHQLEDRIRLVHGDLFAPLKGERYDLILTNPPYVDAMGMAALPKEFRHEPAGALDGGADGIRIVRTIVEEVSAHLNGDGGMLCEVGRGREMVEAAWPQLNFLWLDTLNSSGEVFWIAANDLE
jgi:ribosomal protein L3 glutamine methyltransferase